MTGPRYAELQVTSHFSFLRGASGCDELFAAAAVLGIEALAIVDRNSLAGIVRAHEAAKTTGVRLVVGCRLDLADGMSVLVYPTDRPAYSRLCRLLSLGKKRGGKANLTFSEESAGNAARRNAMTPEKDIALPPNIVLGSLSAVSKAALRDFSAWSVSSTKPNPRKSRAKPPASRFAKCTTTDISANRSSSSNRSIFPKSR